MSEKAMRVTAESGLGIPAHFHYDPYYNRYQEHIKRLVTQGNPIIVRLHPGTYYPMNDDTLHYRVDHEGHVVTIIGYNDHEQVFLLADPWNKEGERSGIVKMPYTQFSGQNVDGTLDAMSIPVPWEMSIDLPENPDGIFDITASITYACPVPLSKSYNHLHNSTVKISLPQGFNLVEDEEVKVLGEMGTFAPGETVKVTWKAEVTEEIVDKEIIVQVRGIVSSDDPYTYIDAIGQRASLTVSLTPLRLLV
ncbi:C39 family peptidase [Rummeliibacillus suwonensis]|uniref:C39 family peptidase n=1 Tax=Rummeliibacillus suwonensis TaxID=1306154 RepID=UPI001AAF2231|nr:C39 family peptidase [Rummeliibacillus suwonensis]MBO2536172.1 C39 family peptidase [Rummeliibacillus suwonensis]